MNDGEMLYDLTYPQQSIWLMEEFYKNTTINNICASARIYEKIDVELMEKAIISVIEQNDVFSIRIKKIEEGVKQLFSTNLNFNIEKIYVKNEKEIEDIENSEVKQKIEILDSSLYTFKILILPDKTVCLILTCSHLIADSWAMGLIIKNILTNYKLLKENKNIEDYNISSYLEYIECEKQYLKSEKYIKDKVFWQEKYNKLPDIVTIPSIKKSIKGLTYSSRRKEFVIDRKIVNKIEEYCKQLNISNFNFFMAVYGIYISKINNSNDFVIGTPILNRTNYKEKNIIGMFVNTVPIRINIDINGKFKQFVKEVGSNVMQSLRHQRYSYNKILEDVRSNNEFNSGLYNVAISYQITKAKENELGNYSTKWIPNKYCGNDFNIHIYDLNNTGNLTIGYDFLTEKYDLTDVENIHSRIMNIINQVINNIDISNSDIEIITLKEKEMLKKFNDTKTNYPRNKSICEIFEEIVEKNKDKVAISYNNTEITYSEFNKKVNQYARYLQFKGVKANDNVVLLSDKSINLYIAMFAILKLGALYVPIDSEYPKARIENIINDCNPKYVLCEKKYFDLVNYDNKCELDIIKEISKYNDENININISPENGAYIIYTSGSTGKPKGVIVPHRGVVRLVKNTNYIKFNKDDRILQNIAIVFDASVFAIFGSLLNGLIMYPINKDEILDFNFFREYIIKNKISIINMTVSLFNKLIDFDKSMFDFVRVVLIGGEVVLPKPVNILKRYLKHIKIINVYGPTENSDLSCCHIIEKQYKNRVPIGKPISNSTCYILNNQQELMPIGVPGEIYVGGDGVAIGYLNRDELNNEVFIQNKFDKGRLYKTGDLGYWQKDGTIQFISRIDKQVKIRGFRVELKEIENKILAFSKIKEVSVIVNESENGNRLIACIGADKKIDIKKLEIYLKSELPFYMIPTKYALFESLPLNVNGKMDTKKILAQIDNEEKAVNKPITKIQKELADIFRKTLNQKEVGINDNFFEIGGDSLSGITLINLINIKYDLPIDLKILFDFPTIRQLEEYINGIKNRKIENDKENNKVKSSYDEINKLLSKNTLSNFLKPKKEKINNLFLTGATGFLGAHILSYFMDNYKGNIYCLIRSKNNIDEEKRLKERLNFYFKNKYDNMFNKRIFVVRGNISQKKFGLTANEYISLGKKVDTLINAAAIVKHFGKSKIFEDINVKGTENVIEFCENNNIKLLHCSTLSLMTDFYKNQDDKYNRTFSEKDFYINQKLNNLYVSTKFKAEELVYKAKIRGLRACCLRIGNISNRFSDGIFQPNVKENSILSKLNTFIEVGYIPDYLLRLPLDFTPVDLCSNAILKIANTDIKYTTYHIVNNNLISIEKLINILSKNEIKIIPINENKFNEIFENIRKTKSTNKNIIGVLQEWIKDKSFKYFYNIKFNSEFTDKYLNELNFKWPNLEDEYFSKYINYFKKIGYFGGEK